MGVFGSIRGASSILEALNLARVEHGVPPLRVLNLGVARYRAADMAARRYFGHCDPEGRHPGYHYTRLGGAYAMEENLGIVVGVEPTREHILNVVEEMIYDDADSNWGHRDSLLDPTNNMVDLGLVKNSKAAFIAIHVQKVWVTWLTRPTYNPRTGSFEAAGRLLLPGSKLSAVTIHHWPPRNPFEHCKIPGIETLHGIACTCSTYSLGAPVAGVAPSKNMYYEGLETVTADTWREKKGSFTIRFRWRPREPGLYTIVIYAKNTIGVKHPYDSSRYADAVPVLKYTVAYQWG